MDILFICRGAWASTLITSLTLAMEARKDSSDVAILFTEEALAALSDGYFRWPQALTGQEMRWKMADNASKAGLPTYGGRGQARRIDVWASITKAKESGIRMFASPLWVTLLGLSGNLPEGLDELSKADESKMLKEATVIIG